MDYKLKYLKYKNKYIQLSRNNKNLKLLRGGSGEVYSINFLWLNRHVKTSYMNQQYIFPFKNILIDINGAAFEIIDIDTILNIINIIEWANLNITSDINIWHDSSQSMVDETNELIHKIYNSDYTSLKLKLEILNKIINYQKKLLRVYKDKRKLDISEILADELTNQYLTITHNYLTEGNTKIEFTPSFKDIIDELNLLIVYNAETKIITYNGKRESSTLSTSNLGELHNLKYKSIITLNRLKIPEQYTKKYITHPEIAVIEHFGLKTDGTLSSFDIIPVYFKVDLVRLIILLQLVKENPNSYAIYADFDTRPLTKDFIFTEESTDLLKKHGLVLPKGQLSKYENSFHILAGENISDNNYMQISIEKILVEFNIQKILHDYKVEPQDVFNNYMDMLLFYSAITFDKPISFHYPPAFNYFSFTENTDDDKKYELQKSDLLNLNIKKVGELYTDEYHGPTDRVGKQLFSRDVKFPIIYPIRVDLASISPHHYNYAIKYLINLY